MTYIATADNTVNITYFFNYLRIFFDIVLRIIANRSFIYYTSHLLKYIFNDGSFNQSVAKKMKHQVT
jgi:hypothetical protein